MVTSQEECDAHIAACSAFRKEYGPGAARSGLVTDFEKAVQISDEAPPPRSATYEDRCAAFAETLLPLLPTAVVSTTGREVKEGAALLATLAASLVHTAADTYQTDDFGLEELMSVLLGPYLSKKSAEWRTPVLAALTPALTALQQALGPKASTDATRALIERALERHAADLRFCTNCAKTEGKLMACTRCKAARYCSGECQKSDWGRHKKLCRPAFGFVEKPKVCKPSGAEQQKAPSEAPPQVSEPVVDI